MSTPNHAIPKAFTPPRWLKNPHVQNILSSSGIRRGLLKFRHSNFRSCSETHIIETPEGVRLLGELNQHTPVGATNQNPPSGAKRKLIILFHGWEGSSNSGYVYSLATTLFNKGYDTFRLNFRDHGDSHYLNKGIFNSTLLNEVLDAISELQQCFQYEQYFLSGFSLGGNFAVRVSANQDKLYKPLSAVVAICPVLNPAITMEAFQSSPGFYESYFVKKWKRSLNKKRLIFPTYDYANELSKAKNLDDLNEIFVPRYTDYDTVKDYFDAYTLKPALFSKINSPTLVIATKDDPVIPIEQWRSASGNHFLTIEEQQHGSHCAFLDSIKLTSWADKRTLAFFNAH